MSWRQKDHNLPKFKSWKNTQFWRNSVTVNSNCKSFLAQPWFLEFYCFLENSKIKIEDITLKCMRTRNRSYFLNGVIQKSNKR